MDILYVFEPKVQKDTVNFSWKFSNDPRVFKRNEFYIQYENMDITDIDSSVFLEMLVSLLVPVLKRLDKQYLIMLPKAIPADSVNAWLSYNEADKINVYPLSHTQELKRNSKNQNKLGILFGGGKDSLYAYKLNKELYGLENLLIISYVFPINYANKKSVDERRDKFALQKLKDDGAEVQKIYTNFRSNFAMYVYFNTLHTQLYFSMSLPLYIKSGLSSITYSYEFTHYFNLDEKRNPLYNFKRSRPEFDDYLSRYFTKRLGMPFKVFNSNYYISENLAFKILKERYDALEDLMMCEAGVDPNKKWCMKCHKCGEFVLYSLANKYHSNGVDYNYFLSESDYILNTIRETEHYDSIRNADGNVAWFDGLITPLHYMSFCHMLNAIDINYWSNYLEEPALSNLKKLIGWFGNKSYDVLDSILSEGLKQLNHPFEKDILSILGGHAKANHAKEIELLFGQKKVIIDYELTYPLLDKVFTILEDEDVSSTLIDDQNPQFLKEYDYKIKAYNEESNISIEYFTQQETRGLSLYIDKSAPVKGDTAEINFSIGQLEEGKSYHIQLGILSPYVSKQFDNRLYYHVLLDNEQVLSEDIAKWGNVNWINLYFKAKSKATTLTVKVTAVKNCESWNWGKAAEVIIHQLQLMQIGNIDSEHISASSPYSILKARKN